MEEHVVITGLGAVSPMGWGVGVLWEGLLAPRCALGSISRFDATPFRAGGGGEVPTRQDDGADDRLLAERYFSYAVGEAIADAACAGLPTALIAGTNFGGMAAAERALAGGDIAALGEYEFRAQVDRCVTEHGLDGPGVTLSLSCASGTAAIVLARDFILSGRAERVVAAGYDELSRYVFAGLAALRAMSPGALKPFDVKRNGTLFSEGAGALVVEDEDAARRRGAHVYARVSGAALTNDAYHMTAPDKEARGISSLMQRALDDARLPPDAIHHVNLHGTATKYNDLNETRALRKVFGERATSIPVTANKGAIGHAMGASGSLETITACLTLREKTIPPTIGLDDQDPECDVNIVRASALDCDVDTILKPSYGIGGTNAAIVLTRV